MTDSEFIEKAYEVAFGDGASDRAFSHEEVATQLLLICQELYRFEAAIEKCIETGGLAISEEDLEYYERILADISKFRDDNSPYPSAWEWDDDIGMEKREVCAGLWECR